MELRYYAPRDSQDPVWVVLFDDPDRDLKVFIGSGAEKAAKAYWREQSKKWSCTLLTSVPMEPCEHRELEVRDRRHWCLSCRQEVTSPKGRLVNYWRCGFHDYDEVWGDGEEMRIYGCAHPNNLDRCCLLDNKFANEEAVCPLLEALGR